MFRHKIKPSPFCAIPVFAPKHCIAYELGSLVQLILCLLFLYQVVYVWKCLYKYSFRSDMRLWVLVMCIVYLLLDVLKYFMKKRFKVPTAAFLDYLRYQIIAICFLYYYHKILNILPTI